MGDAAAGLTPPPPARRARSVLRAFYSASAGVGDVHGRPRPRRRLPDWSPRGLAGEADEMRSLRRDSLGAAGGPTSVRRSRTSVDLASPRAPRDCARRARERTLRPPQPVAVDRRGDLRRAVAGHARFAPWPSGSSPRAAAARGHPGFLEPGREIVRSAARLEGPRQAECQAARELFGDTLPAWVETEPAPAAAWTRRLAAGCTAFEAFDAWLGPTAQPPLLSAFRSSMPDAPSERETAGRDLLALLLTRGHFVTTPIDDLLREATDALDEATARLDEMSRHTAAGPRCRSCWPAITPRPTVLARFERKWRACKDASTRRPRHLARRAAALRAIPGAHPRRRAASLLPALPLAGAVRSLRHVRLRRAADRWSAAGGRSSAGCAG